MINENKQIKVVSMFSGCGGGDLGLIGGFKFLGKNYKKNKLNIIWANDNEHFAVETYKKNLGKHIIHGDINLIKEKNIPEHDILIGGFPCQSFSIVGLRKGLGDPRGKLYQEIIRVLKAKKPKVFIGENVKGLKSVQCGVVFNKIIKDFENVGYNISYKILNASKFGVPQKRERIIIIGIRKDLKITFNFPRPIDKIIPLKNVIEKEKNIEAKYYFSKRAVEGLMKANKIFNKGRIQDVSIPCNTISSHLAKVSLNGTDPVLFIKNKGYRRFTPREAARIQSFPDDFVFIGSESKKYIQIGNAIPPVVMWHVGKEVIKQVFNNSHARKKL